MNPYGWRSTLWKLAGVIAIGAGGIAANHKIITGDQFLFGALYCLGLLAAYLLWKELNYPR